MFCLVCLFMFCFSLVFYCILILNCINIFKLINYFWLCWVIFAACGLAQGLSLVGETWGYVAIIFAVASLVAAYGL